MRTESVDTIVAANLNDPPNGLCQSCIGQALTHSAIVVWTFFSKSRLRFAIKDLGVITQIIHESDQAKAGKRFPGPDDAPARQQAVDVGLTARRVLPFISIVSFGDYGFTDFL